MSPYAEGTSVPVSRSRAEIEEIVSRYGGSNFISGFLDDQNKAVLTFMVGQLRVQFELPLPLRQDFAAKTITVAGANYRYEKQKPVSPEQQGRAWEQACRQRWRALALVIKAKLEAVSCGITTFEEEFLANIVVPGGKRFAQHALPAIASAYKTGKLPPLLGSGQ